MAQINPLEELEFLLDEIGEQMKLATEATPYQVKILQDGKGLLLALLDYPQFPNTENLITNTVKEIDRAIKAMDIFSHKEALSKVHTALVNFTKAFSAEAYKEAR